MLINANALHIPLPDKSVHCCVTSPPYYGLRDYGISNQIGLEQTPEAYVSNIVNVFREVWRVLRDDGTCWVNLGDSYWGGKGKSGYELPHEAEDRRAHGETLQTSHNIPGYMDTRPTDGKHETIKPKDLLGIPWRVAFALQADGWYLRSDIIWHKPNPMPESVTDRPTKSHEYIFLLSKSQRYYYDNDAVREPHKDASMERYKHGFTRGKKSNDDYVMADRYDKVYGNLLGRNRRTVWTISTSPYKGAHFATYPSKLIVPCILAGCPGGGIVLDPFAGSGTTIKVALEYGRQGIGLDLSLSYLTELASKRIASAQPMLVTE